MFSPHPLERLPEHPEAECSLEPLAEKGPDERPKVLVFQLLKVTLSRLHERLDERVYPYCAGSNVSSTALEVIFFENFVLFSFAD